MIRKIIIEFPESHMDEHYRQDMYLMFKHLCANIDVNGLICKKE